MKFLVGLFITLFSFVALAIDTIPDSTDAIAQLIGPLIQAIMTGQYMVVGGFALMIAMFVIRQYVLPAQQLTEGVLKLATAITGILFVGGTALVAGQSFTTAIAVAMGSVLFASGLWDYIGESLMKFIYKQVGLEYKKTIH